MAAISARTAQTKGDHGTLLPASDAEFPPPVPLRPSAVVARLSALAAVLAFVAAGAGLLWSGGEGPFSFTTARGQVTEIYGQGLYQHDTLFIGSLNRGTDAVTLFLGIPLLAVAMLRYRRGSVRGGLLLLGALAWFLYVGASYALGAVAYNDLFLVYVALLSSSLFALVLAFRSFDAGALAARVATRAPRRGPALFLFASAAVTLAVWLVTPVTALITGEPPERLDTYSTLFTNAFDMAVIVPSAVIAGALILRRNPLGRLLAVPLLMLEVFLAPMIAAQTVSQQRAGVTLGPGEIIGPVAGFVTFALLAAWVLAGQFRALAGARVDR